MIQYYSLLFTCMIVHSLPYSVQLVQLQLLYISYYQSHMYMCMYMDVYDQCQTKCTRLLYESV